MASHITIVKHFVPDLLYSKQQSLYFNVKYELIILLFIWHANHDIMLLLHLCLKEIIQNGRKENYKMIQTYDICLVRFM